MRRSDEARAPASGRRLAAWLFPLVLVGCAPNEISFGIIQGQVPQPSGMGNACFVLPDPGGAKRDRGVLDVLIRNSYVLYPLYRSELFSTMNTMTGYPETRGLFVDRAEVTLRRGSDDPSRPALAEPYSVVLSNFVPPARSGTPGYGVGTLELIPPSIVENVLRPQVCQIGMPTAECPRPEITSNDVLVVASVRVFGHTMGNVQLEGATYTFPIQVCCGCLLTFPLDARAAMDPVSPGNNCNGGMLTANVCDPGQDAPTDCRVCSGQSVLCQPPGYGAMCGR